ncbi:MAG: hypothetical protein UU72_C0005G0029 [candidate division WWE3 bacterium GW2011_GWB1_41_6]|uniref:Uncharacterized protein n=2 Tax=Katanobacteria TaxID=422282 RepID=A0A1F4VJ41_UNCKA|nr:MAG: hypothetical protein UU72_C0005G0029 [candidate division WWE3 bacterium GW2011_GWB1_41_6]OGC57189.1 MAG: hypothetical protein A2976_00775 [candidate division WWE3 bacterium RIFCSPLOWO2_01_FULL_41_9]
MNITDAAYKLSQELKGKVPKCRVHAGKHIIFVDLDEEVDKDMVPTIFFGYSIEVQPAPMGAWDYEQSHKT